MPGYSSLHYTIRDKLGLRCNAGGGVGLWVDSSYSFEPIIDHISSSSQDDRYDAGIIISALSDHLPVYYIKHCEPYCPPIEPVKFRVMNDKTIQNFQHLLSSSSWDEVLSENRPEHAYKYFLIK